MHKYALEIQSLLQFIPLALKAKFHKKFKNFESEFLIAMS